MGSSGKYLFRAAAGFLLLAGLIWMVDWEQLVQILSGISLFWIIALLAVSALLVWISCVKWRLFLVARGVSISIGRLVNLYLIGYFFNNFAPSNVGGDVLRSYMLGEHIGSKSESFGAVFLERFTGFVALIGMAVVAAIFRPDVFQSWVLTGALALMAMFFGLTIFLLVSHPFYDWIKRLLAERSSASLLKKAEKFLDVIFYFRAHRPIMIRALILSAFFHLFTVVNTQVACWALNIDIHILELAVIVPVVLVIAAIPISINSLGVMEGGFVYFLSARGVDPAAALSVALVLRAKNILLAMIGGVLLIRWNRILPKLNEGAAHDG